MTKRTYRIWNGTLDTVDVPAGKSLKDVLGGKGAGLHDMVTMGLNVPPAFTIPCAESMHYLALSESAMRGAFLDKLMLEVIVNDLDLEDVFGFEPLLSVRSGASVSMPGMMDTILNVGLNDETLPEWMDRIGERAALDSYRRLIQMLGATAYGIDMAMFDERLALAKSEAGVTLDTELDPAALKSLIVMFKACFEAYAFAPFPQGRADQIRAAIRAVFNSWNNPRARTYRDLNKIPHDIGTAVTVQAMVFGNMGDTSATGVLFSRDPSTGANTMMGEFLVNAQGEDVVAGIRTPFAIDGLLEMNADIELWGSIHGELVDLCAKLEAHYRDMVDIEFTVQAGELFVLQCRPGKRSAIAAFRIGMDLLSDGVISADELFSRLTRAQYSLATRPSLDPSFKAAPVATGLPACPGVVTGRVVLTSKEAVEAKDPVILVTHETDPDDIAGMARAVGILTATGGATSHAAVVARGMDKPCVVGCTALEFQGSLIGFAGVALLGTTISICGATGRVWAGAVPVVDGSADASVRAFGNLALAVTGSVETSPVDLGEGVACRITASDWWGQTEVLQAVLDGIAYLPDRSLVSLDVTPPVDLMRPSDEPLLTAFGGGLPAAVDPKWRSVICAKVLSRAGDLQGLTVIGTQSPATRADMAKAGIKAAGPAITIADLLTGAPVTLSEAFISDVVGGQAALETLKGMLEAQGLGIKPMPLGVPRDYAALAVLAR